MNNNLGYNNNNGNNNENSQPSLSDAVYELDVPFL